jgi:hypothetical protein
MHKNATNLGKIHTNIVHFNIRSLDRHFGELTAFNTQTDNVFDYIALSEIGTKNIEARKALLSTMGYQFHYKLSHLSKGGVGLITDKEKEIKIRPEFVFKNTKYNKVNLTTESLWLERIFKDEKLNFILGVIYRHPSSTVECLEDFTNQLSNILQKIEKENKKVYIVGDLNIDGLKVKNNRHVENFFNMLLGKNYVPLITKPTRIQDTSISLIDHTIINASTIKADAKIRSGIIYSGITDHLPVFVSIQESHRVTPKERPQIRIYSKNNDKKFYQNIKRSNWEKFKRTESITEALSIFYSNWKKCFDEAYPLTKLSRRKSKHKPWISAELAKEINYKNKLHYETLHNPTSTNKAKLKKVRNQVTNKIKSAHGKYYQNIINGEKNRLQTMWNLFGSVMNPKKTREKTKIRQLKVKQKNVTDDKEIANSLNDFFCGVGSELAKKHNNDYETYKKYLGPRILESIELTQTEEIEIFHILGNFNKKSSGADEIQPKILKKCRKIISPLLAHLYNLCFKQKTYPDILKIAKVIPLFKKKDEEERQDPGNYRPISLLSALNKILEKIIYKRLIRFIDMNDILYKYQFGFRRNHSTTLALMDVIDKIRENLSKGTKVAGFFY